MIDLSFVSVPVLLIIEIYFLLWCFLALIVLIKKFKIKYTTPKNHLVSIILPSRNEQAVIGNLLEHINKQSYKNIEVIVVAHNCSDNTYDIANKYIGSFNFPLTVHRLDTKEFGKGLALNYGVKNTTGDLIVYFDTDNDVPKDTIKKLVEWEDRGYDGVQSRISSKNADYNFLTFMQDIEFAIYSTVFCGGKHRLGMNSGIGGTGVMVSRKALDKIGGFHNVLIEDFDLIMRLTMSGYKIAYAEDADVFDEKVISIKALLKQRARWLAGQFQIWKLYSFKQVFSLWKYPIDFLYYFNPICIIALLISFGLSFISSMGLPIEYYSLPWQLWVVLMIIANILFGLVLKKYRPKLSFLLAITMPYILFLYSFHWFIVFFKSFFINGWKDTKTQHGMVNFKVVEVKDNEI